jgi:hypothetical protein
MVLRMVSDIEGLYVLIYLQMHSLILLGALIKSNVADKCIVKLKSTRHSITRYRTINLLPLQVLNNYINKQQNS